MPRDRGSRKSTFAFLVFASAIGCTSGLETPPPASSPSPAPVASAAPTPQPTATPTLTSAPVGEWQIELATQDPVMAPTDLGNYDFTMPATYFETDGVRHAYVVGFGQARGDQKVFHATSTDGLDWSIDPADPFAGLGIAFSPPGPIPGTVLPSADGTWLMYLWGIPVPLQDGAKLWRATSTAPGGPWIADPDPVLEVGARGAWDDHGLDFPAVVPTATGYRMLYGANGRSKPDSSAIGRATSTDGRVWQRDSSNPVVTSELCQDALDQASLPRVIQRDELPSVLLWQGGMDIRIATSPDGTTWTCASDLPALTDADLPNSDGIHSYAAGWAGDEISLLVESLFPTPTGLESRLFLARAIPPT